MDALFTVLGNLGQEGAAVMKRTRKLLPAVMALAASALLASQAWADPLILQGSTTFNRRVMETHQAEIESKSGQELTVIPNRSMLGIIALLEGRAHMAMTSASIEGEVGKLKKAMPWSAAAFPISRA